MNANSAMAWRRGRARSVARGVLRAKRDIVRVKRTSAIAPNGRPETPISICIYYILPHGTARAKEGAGLCRAGSAIGKNRGQSTASASPRDATVTVPQTTDNAVRSHMCRI